MDDFHSDGVTDVFDGVGVEFVLGRVWKSLCWECACFAVDVRVVVVEGDRVCVDVDVCVCDVDGVPF